MRRIVLAAGVTLGVFGSGVVSAAPSGVKRDVTAQGTTGDVRIEAKGPVEVRHAVVTIEPGGTTGWASWPGPLVATVRSGALAYRNGSEDECARRTINTGESFVIPADSVFEGINEASSAVEIHTVAFFPPRSAVKVRDRPVTC